MLNYSNFPRAVHQQLPSSNSGSNSQVDVSIIHEIVMAFSKGVQERGEGTRSVDLF